MTALARYEQTRHTLTKCQRGDEVKDLRDNAGAMAAYARQAKDTELIQFATEIKVRAERKCGEMLAQAEKNDGGRPVKNQSNHTTGFVTTPTLADMGITKDQSSRYQSLASMSDAHFATAAASGKNLAT